MFHVTKFERQPRLDTHYDYVESTVKSCFSSANADKCIKEDDPTAKLVMLDYLPNNLMYAVYGTATSTLYNIKEVV